MVERASRRNAVAFAAIAVVALAHLLPVGRWLDGTWSRLWHGYFSDLAIPFALYLLWSARSGERGIFADWRRRAAAVFGVAAFDEVLQGLGVSLLGRTFDPADFAMYALGVTLALLIERRW